MRWFLLTCLVGCATQPTSFPRPPIYIDTGEEVAPRTRKEVQNPMPEVARMALQKAEQMEVFALDPKERQQKDSKDNFHGWKILKRVSVTDAATCQKLGMALTQGANESTGVRAACFIPHHGLRVQSQGTTTDFVICFMCLRVQVYPGMGFPITTSPRPVFDEILKSNHETR